MVHFAAPVVQDNCTGATFECYPPSGATFAVGTNTVVCAATDGGGSTNGCSFTVIVNRAPVAGTDAMIAIASNPASVSLDVLLANDSDPDGHALSITAVSPTSTNGGAVEISGTNVVYAPAAGFTGQDLFTYILSDALGGTGTGEVVVTVFPETYPSYNRIANFSVAPGRVGMSLLGIPGKTYKLERSEDLVGWAEVGQVSAPADGWVHFADLAPPAGGAFYRVAAN